MSQLTVICTLVLLGVAALTDWRRGEIPNWLTLPPLLIAPFGWWCMDQLSGVYFSILGLFGCGLIPYFAFRAGAMGGGDVKLFAALGAINGVALGTEMIMLSLFAGVVQTLFVLARQGRLVSCMRNCVWLTTNAFLPKRHRRTIETITLTELRLGPAILVGSAFALVLA